MGEPCIVLKPQEAPERAKKFRELIQSPVLTGIQIDFRGFEVYDVEPPSIPDLMADRPLILFGKWRGEAKGEIRIRGHHGDEPFQSLVEVDGSKPMDQNSALPYLWARHRIAVLSDFNRLRPQDERVTEVTNLGLTYNLLTAYTSFIAVDAQVRLVNGQTVTVKQPLPLPQGVSDYAVGRGGLMMKTAAPAAEAKLQEADKGRRYSRPADEKGRLALKSVSVPDGMNEEVVRAEIEKNLSSLNDSCGFCLKQARDHSVTEIKLVLEYGKDGRVKKVTADGKSECSVKLENCMKAKLLGLQFPSPANRAGGKVELILVLT
jgi:Ca-activated chloride channel family protein